MVFPLLPCKSHVLTVESMLGSGCCHHFLGDGCACILCKGLELLLLARVDSKWKVRINSLVEISNLVIEIKLAELCVCNGDMGDKLS
jgi:hypothetical protein